MSADRTLDLTEVRHVAALARLALTEEEATALRGDLTSILRYVDKLEELETTGIEPTTHAVPLATRLRSDEVHPGLLVDEGLRNAPERIADGFGVPQIIE